jgi:predicted nucleotidyltransferase component of viral defense system
MVLNIVKEYFQYKLLDHIYSSKFGEKLSFMGGTCIRIIYGSDRFSEDLDFDNFGMSFDEFVQMTAMLKSKFEQEGIIVESRAISSGAFRCYYKIPEVLKSLELSGFEEQKLLIKIDTAYQKYQFRPDVKIINKFGIFQEIIVNPAKIILSQKICALLLRPRLIVRDIYDIVTLYGFTKPDYEYLEKVLKIKTISGLKSRIIKRLEGANLDKLSDELKNFVTSESKLLKVKKFRSWLLNTEL